MYFLIFFCGLYFYITLAKCFNIICLQKNDTEESIGESGSIFVRNLPYVVSEEELTALFQKYGKY